MTLLGEKMVINKDVKIVLQKIRVLDTLLKTFSHYKIPITNSFSNRFWF